MPNWCSNTVSLEGKIENIRAFLVNAYAQYKTRNEIDVFQLHPENEMYVFDFYSHDIDFLELTPKEIGEFEDQSIVLQYSTRWNPNLQDTEFIGKIFQLNIRHEYEESGMRLYGECSYDYTTNRIDHKYLNDQEIASCDDDEGERDWDKLEDLLNAKPYADV
jgi:hypothetical protein